MPTTHTTTPAHSPMHSISQRQHAAQPTLPPNQHQQECIQLVKHPLSSANSKLLLQHITLSLMLMVVTGVLEGVVPLPIPYTYVYTFTGRPV